MGARVCSHATRLRGACAPLDDACNAAAVAHVRAIAADLGGTDVLRALDAAFPTPPNPDYAPSSLNPEYGHPVQRAAAATTSSASGGGDDEFGAGIGGSGASDGGGGCLPQ